MGFFRRNLLKNNNNNENNENNGFLGGGLDCAIFRTPLLNIYILLLLLLLFILLCLIFKDLCSYLPSYFCNGHIEPL